MTELKPAPDDTFDTMLAEAVHEPVVLVPGTALCGGRFVIRRLLGRGGMGVVYEASAAQLDVALVVKTLSAVDGPGIYRLKQEFRSLTNVVHPNLVGLHELICDEGLWFITMDRVAGRTLDQALGFMPSGAALRRIFSQVAAGIGAIHRAGKLHRDLKPNNVMVTPEGRAVILDFGLACDRVDVDGCGVTDSIVVGTPTYMAPEQASGLPASEAVDWYALGVMLYEALAGRPPFLGTGGQVLEQKQREDAPPLCGSRAERFPELARLGMALLSRDPSSRPGLEEVTAVLAPTAVLPGDVGAVGNDSAATPFVGRQAELAALRQAWTTDLVGPVAVRVHGPSGIGKTALIERFLARLSREPQTVVLTGRCYESESVPYKTCDSLIDAAFRHLERQSLPQRKRLVPPHLGALAKVFPVFAPLVARGSSDQPVALPTDPAEQRRQLEAALKELLRRLAERARVVLFVDDCQWSDVDGARLLGSVLHPPAAAPVLLICAYRTQDVSSSPGLRALLRSIERMDASNRQTIALDALDERQARSLAGKLLPFDSQRVIDRITCTSEGNPFLITMLSRYAERVRDGEGPDIDRAIGHASDTLGEDCRRLLEAVCVAGRAVSSTLLGAVANCEDWAAPLRRLHAMHLLRRTGGDTDKVAPYHDRIRASIVSGLESRRVTEWHVRFARAIEAADSPDAIELTHHYLAAGERQRAGQCAKEAARQAEAALAFDQAVDLYDIALDHGCVDDAERLRVQLCKAEALLNGLRAAEAGYLLLETASLASEPADRGELRRRGGELLLLAGQVDAGIRELRQAFADHDLDYDALCSANFMTSYFDLLERGLAFTPRARADVDAATLRQLDTLWGAAFGLSHLKYAETFALVMHYTMMALDVGEPGYVVQGLMGVSVFEASLIPREAPVYEALQSICAEQQSDRFDIYLALAQANIAAFLSRPTEIVSAGERALELISTASQGLPRERSFARMLLLSAYFQMGDWRRLWDISLPWAEEAKRLQNAHLCAWTDIYQTICHLVTGSPDRARESIDRALSYWGASIPDIIQVAVHQYRALCASDAEDPEGLQHIARAEAAIGASLLAFNPLKRCDQAYFHGLVSLRLAALRADPESLLVEVEQCAGALESFVAADGRELSFGYWVPQAKLLRAGLCHVRGHADRALTELDLALAGFERNDSSKMSHACARRCKGRLVGGDSGDQLIRLAEAELGELGVSSLDRACALFAPGFD